jgi:hypothetical protein
MKYSSCKDINVLVKKLLRQGWHVVNGKKHPKLYAPNRKKCVVFSKSPSDSRAFQNFKHNIKAMTQLR